jgi:ATP-dependent Clp protease, protease subunit
VKFWNFKGSGDKRAELLLYGDISDSTWWGDEVTPKQFKADMDALGDVKEFDIYINSGGGDVFAGFAIYNMLKRHEARKTVFVDGLAASIASVIAMAGDKIVMPENAMLMIHNAWALVMGNKAKLRKLADDMEKIDGSIAGIYAARTGKTEADIVALMDAETWFTAAEAVDAGLADKIEASKKLAASVDGEFLSLNGLKFDLSRYKDAAKPKTIAPERAEPPKGGFFMPDNGGDIQPVADTTENALQGQRRQFNDIRKKLLEGV